MNSVTFVSPCGMLGYGYPLQSLRTAMSCNPDFIGVDCGSTDPGPYYLGTGKSFVHPLQLKRDVGPLLTAAGQADIPLIIGTAGGSGSNENLEFFVEILLESARENNLHFKLATIQAGIEKSVVLNALENDRISPCGFSGRLSRDDIRETNHIVAQMGTEPIIKALQKGADVIVAGRSCDTAIFASLPIMRGFNPALSLHAAKIAECGTLCATPAGANDAIICTINQGSFHVVPADPNRKCTPETVAAHSLYEQPDPNCFYEPEGKVDLSQCDFTPDDDRGVIVTGTNLIPPVSQTVKLEGTALRGYRSITIAGVRDEKCIENLDVIENSVRQAVQQNVSPTMNADEYSLRFLRYGLDAVMGKLERSTNKPHEVGLLIEAIAPTQQQADMLLGLARSTCLHQHFPGRKTTAGNLAFPFSPSDMQAGQVWEFSVYHLMETDDQTDLFPITVREI